MRCLADAAGIGQAVADVPRSHGSGSRRAPSLAEVCQDFRWRMWIVGGEAG